ncbi:MAG: hypothetical protein R8G66_04705 [Cytophagales bacterium]|nr:hypothetical protein [Cytophagales bacterium]
MTKLIGAFLLCMACNFTFAQDSDFQLKKSRLKLVKGHFFDQHYDWENPDINLLLELTGKRRKVGNVLLVSGLVSTLFVVGIIAGPIAVTAGLIIKGKGRKMFWQATITRNYQLTNGQTYSGSEFFRERPNARWFYRKNFHVQYYDGSNPAINDELLLSIKHHQMARKQSKWMTIFGGVGTTLAIIAGDKFFANAFARDNRTDRNVLVPFISSVVLGSIGLKFFSLSGKSSTRAYRHLQTATYQWYDDMNEVKRTR